MRWLARFALVAIVGFGFGPLMSILQALGTR
jgi:hypothetical protein